MMRSFRHSVKLESIEFLKQNDNRLKVKHWVKIVLLLFFSSLFLPWTQNVKSRGKVTTLFQDQRPQEIHSPIPGRIEKWYAKEGDLLKKGDTILKISEIKAEYLDPQLIDRTKQQTAAKRNMLQSYQSNADAYSKQVVALERARELKLQQLTIKLQQLDNKVRGEEAELEAARNEASLLKDQMERQQKMFDQGLVSQTQLQQRNQVYQNALAKKVMVENKLLQTRQDKVNTQLEQSSVTQDYTEKINKAEGERYKVLSMLAEGQGDLAKLENQVSNYTIRNGLYILLAPQDGQLIQAKKAGIGEILKEGEQVAIIVPNKTSYAVELFIRPMDLPLINVGQKVRFTFDGFPAIIFSGWPENSYGTFGGKVYAVEKNIQSNNLFRVVVVPDPNEKLWPEYLTLGTGAQGIALLNDVQVWYELWRNVNGFPPDFYTMKNESPNESKK
jgi:multidrug resistance efflux pump